MKKIILVLSLLFSLIGFFSSFFFVFVDYNNLTDFIRFIATSVQPYRFSGLDIYVQRHIIGQDLDTSSIGMSLVNLFFYTSFFAGAIIYYASKFKETKLLLFNFCLIIISSIIKIIYCIIYFNNENYDIYQILYTLLTVFYLFISYKFIIKYLNYNENIINDNEDKTEISYLENASNNKRFLNLLVDNFTIIVISYGFLIWAEHNDVIMILFKTLRNTFGETSGLFVFFSIVKFIYYISFEGTFKSTPAKFLTSCYVTDEEGNIPDFSMILKRTLCRFVPFEAFSFLMGRNFHDDYSSTYVINKKRDHNIEKLYLQFLGIGFLIFFSFYIYKEFFNDNYYGY